MLTRKFKAYGDLIQHWRNEVKRPREMVAKETEINSDRYKRLEAGEDKPTWPELERLAKNFCVSVRDLLPYDDDLERGVKILRNKKSQKIEQMRSGRHQYTYWSRVMTSALPNIKPVELLLHLNSRDDVVMNRGHFFHQFTQVLYGGPVAFLWKHKGETYEEVFEEGDSWLIPGYVPHGFYSPNKDSLGRILAITLGQNLMGDAREELRLIGSENIPRIISDDKDYY